MTVWVETPNGAMKPLEEAVVTKEELAELWAKVDILTEQVEELKALVEQS